MSTTGEVRDTAASVVSDGSSWWVPPLKTILAALLALLMAVSLGAAIWAWHYQPLTGSGGWVAAGRVSEPGFVGLQPGVQITNAYGTEWRLTGVRSGERIGMVFGLYNQGRFPVRISAIGSPLHRYNTAEVQAFQSESLGRDGAPYGPFRPFTLRPGELRSVAVTVRFRCGPPSGGSAERTPAEPTAADRAAADGGAGDIWSTVGVWPVPVTYRFLGLSQQAHVSPPYAMTLVNDGCASRRR